MNEEQCRQIALFRYGIIADFVNQTSLEFGVREKLLSYKSSCKWRIPNSDRTQISRGTIIRWIRLYSASGCELKALYPRERNDINQSRVIDQEISNSLKWLAINSDVDNVPSLMREMKHRELIDHRRSLSTSTVYRFLHANNLMPYLEERKENYKVSVANNEEDILWLQKLLQGKICLSDLKNELSCTTPPQDVEKLYACIKERPLRYRKRAAGVLSLCKGISRQTITENLNIPYSTLLRNFEMYSDRGVNHIVSEIRNYTHVYEDQKYIDKLFSIIHSPPSTYGFNRTTWKQKDIRQVMADCNMPVSSHSLKKIIDNSGYKYRKARTTLTSNDPSYREKVQNIKNILSNLKENEKFFSVDEYGPFAIKMQGGKSLVPAGTRKTVPQWQKSKGSIIVTAALELSTNQITHFYSKNKNTTEMIKLLNLLIEKYPNQECVYFSWDAASWHASKELQKKVDEINSTKVNGKTKLPKVKLAPLPACAQFLNVIESVFSGMARAIIHNSDYKTVGECKSSIDRHFSERNEYFQKHPKRAGNKIWGKERVKPIFSESNNCKDPLYR